MTTVSSSTNDSTNNAALVVCTAPLIQQLTQARIPPNYIGTRRIAVAAFQRRGGSSNNHHHQQDAKKSSLVVFKVLNPDGTERRMTRPEKKALKQKLAQERKDAKRMADKEGQERKTQTIEDESPSNDDDDDVDDDSTIVFVQEKFHAAADSTAAAAAQTTAPNYYHQLPVNPTAMQQELEEFRVGDRREGLPPVMLSPPMALCASNSIMRLSSNNAHSNNNINYLQYDEALSEKWARLLKDSMLAAETIRQGEDMRPMAYQLTPEAWTRMRFAEGQQNNNGEEKKLDTRVHSNVFETATATAMATNNDWLRATCRTPSSLDVAVAVVFDYLHQCSTHLHVSCGAKFGSDFLVYDGPRSERHAFAGMRVLLPIRNDNDDDDSRPSKCCGLPLPSPYDMAGYVRCLNTAGKLALLATVVEERCPGSETVEGGESSSTLYRVAIVDMALEKILSAPTHQKHARTEKRRDISRNLAKKQKVE